MKLIKLFLKPQSFSWVLKHHGDSCGCLLEYLALKKYLKICSVVQKHHVEITVGRVKETVHGTLQDESG